MKVMEPDSLEVVEAKEVAMERGESAIGDGEGGANAVGDGEE